jgi:hypothetical protein
MVWTDDRWCEVIDGMMGSGDAAGGGGGGVPCRYCGSGWEPNSWRA